MAQEKAEKNNNNKLLLFSGTERTFLCMVSSSFRGNEQATSFKVLIQCVYQC